MAHRDAGGHVRSMIAQQISKGLRTHMRRSMRVVPERFRPMTIASRRFVCTKPPVSSAALSAGDLDVPSLVSLLRDRNVDFSDCFDVEELRARAVAVLQAEEQATQSPNKDQVAVSSLVAHFPDGRAVRHAMGLLYNEGTEQEWQEVLAKQAALGRTLVSRGFDVHDPEVSDALKCLMVQRWIIPVKSNSQNGAAKKARHTSWSQVYEPASVQTHRLTGHSMAEFNREEMFVTCPGLEDTECVLPVLSIGDEAGLQWLKHSKPQVEMLDLDLGTLVTKVLPRTSQKITAVALHSTWASGLPWDGMAHEEPLGILTESTWGVLQSQAEAFEHAKFAESLREPLEAGGPEVIHSAAWGQLFNAEFYGIADSETLRPYLFCFPGDAMKVVQNESATGSPASVVHLEPTQVKDAVLSLLSQGHPLFVCTHCDTSNTSGPTLSGFELTNVTLSCFVKPVLAAA